MSAAKLTFIASILLAGVAAFANPASAKEASRSSVLAACSHQSDCSIITNNPGGTIGCTDKACFYCNQKSCHEIKAEAGPGKTVLPNTGFTVATSQGLTGSQTIGPGNSSGNGLAKAQASAVAGKVTFH